MTVIGLVRHGITDWNLQRRAQGQTDIPLNKTGILQAEALANRLLEDSWNLVVSSDLSRAYDTANAVSKKLNIPIFKDKRLREIHFGQIEGKTEEERIETWGPAWKELDLGGEKNESAQERSVACIEDFYERYPNKRILFVSHGATLNQLIKGLLKDPSFNQRFDNTSLSLFNKESKSWKCSLLNCAKHNDEVNLKLT